MAESFHKTNPQTVGDGGLAAARSTRGSDSPPDCHSLPLVPLRYLDVPFCGRMWTSAPTLYRGRPACPPACKTPLPKGGRQMHGICRGDINGRTQFAPTRGTASIICRAGACSRRQSIYKPNDRGDPLPYNKFSVCTLPHTQKSLRRSGGFAFILLRTRSSRGGQTGTPRCRSPYTRPPARCREWQIHPYPPQWRSHTRKSRRGTQSTVSCRRESA